MSYRGRSLIHAGLRPRNPQFSALYRSAPIQAARVSLPVKVRKDPVCTRQYATLSVRFDAERTATRMKKIPHRESGRAVRGRQPHLKLPNIKGLGFDSSALSRTCLTYSGMRWRRDFHSSIQRSNRDPFTPPGRSGEDASAGTSLFQRIVATGVAIGVTAGVVVLGAGAVVLVAGVAVGAGVLWIGWRIYLHFRRTVGVRLGMKPPVEPLYNSARALKEGVEDAYARSVTVVRQSADLRRRFGPVVEVGDIHDTSLMAGWPTWKGGNEPVLFIKFGVICQEAPLTCQAILDDNTKPMGIIAIEVGTSSGDIITIQDNSRDLSSDVNFDEGGTILDVEYDVQLDDEEDANASKSSKNKSQRTGTPPKTYKNRPKRRQV